GAATAAALLLGVVGRMALLGDPAAPDASGGTVALSGSPDSRDPRKHLTSVAPRTGEPVPHGDPTAGPMPQPAKVKDALGLVERRALRLREGRPANGFLGPVGGEDALPEGYSAEEYASLQDNPFLRVGQEPLSTFSIDVDTASYANVRRFLASGQVPPADAVRVEELVNYFRYDYEPPRDGAPFSVQVEAHKAPWAPKHHLVRIGLRAIDVSIADAPASNLVFLVDVSGSMGEENKLPLVKRSLRLLVEQMRRQDSLSLVTYAGQSGLLLPPTPGDRKAEILEAIDRMGAGGSTNGAAGIQEAYRVAQENMREGGINRVLLCTDGDFNVGASSEGELSRLIEEKRASGVFLSVLGFGRGNYADARMQALAQKGNGNAAYIDSFSEAKKVLVEQATGTLLTIAKDVKIQIEFNPAHVAGYRLIGYENRMLQAQDFNDDTKDAGEIGAGHSVTALYEVIPAGVEVPGGDVDPLKYQKPPVVEGNPSAELFTVKLRYKKPDGDVSEKIEVPYTPAAAEVEPSADFHFASSVAAFGMLLRNSPHKGTANWGLVEELGKGGLGRDPEGWRKEFVELVKTARGLAETK
ncbi:MAG: VWA domain-containing protein, partial [Candidatus Brocadiae bacterium]|nr:VWA domain-containing protein [Candidatus Brocadiia bacterium]